MPNTALTIQKTIGLHINSGNLRWPGNWNLISIWIYSGFLCGCHIRFCSNVFPSCFLWFAFYFHSFFLCIIIYYFPSIPQEDQAWWKLSVDLCPYDRQHFKLGDTVEHPFSRFCQNQYSHIIYSIYILNQYIYIIVALLHSILLIIYSNKLFSRSCRLPRKSRKLDPRENNVFCVCDSEVTTFVSKVRHNL